MEKSNTSVFFKHLYNPVWQGGVIFILVVLTMLIFKGLHASQNIDIDCYRRKVFDGMRAECVASSTNGGNAR